MDARPSSLSRRDALRLTATASLGSVFAPRLSLGADNEPPGFPHGAVIGEPAAAKAGMDVLADGGNAVDAAVAAALVAGVVAPHQCGPGGYGGSMVIALARTRKVTAIDFNTAAPAAMREDLFEPGPDGKVRDRINEFGWLATGVPGTLAGLDLAWRRHGTRPFHQVFWPAIALAEDGFKITGGFAVATRGTAAQLSRDPASAKLLLVNGEPLKAGDTFRNPELAAMLKSFLVKKSVHDFYRGDIAQRIAEAFAKRGGLVTAKDLARYEARELKPLEVEWGDYTVRTTPLASGGLTPLQALAVLKSLRWDERPASFARTWLRIETLRAVWRDRLQLLGDTADNAALAARLLSRAHAAATGADVLDAVQNRRPPAPAGVPRDHGGTVHLSAVDRDGNMAALTLTHGNSFGACVTVPGLGLTLGHGMSRFEPQPGHPNAPGPGKRPLHNMCPAIVSRGGRPVLALGGAGGRRIPNALLDVLIETIVAGAPLADAVAAPRLNTEGGLDVNFEAKWPKEERDYFAGAGYKAGTGPIARVSAVSFDARTGESRAASR